MTLPPALARRSPDVKGERAPAVHRIEVWTSLGQVDSRSCAVTRLARANGVIGDVRAVAIYLIEGDLSQDELATVADSLLADPVTQSARIRAAGTQRADQSDVVDVVAIEVHPLAGVTDPAAESVQEAIAVLVGATVTVRTGERLEFRGVLREAARQFVERFMANAVIQSIHDGAYWPESLPHGHDYQLSIREVPIRALGDAALERMSREAHLFLSLDEMRAIQAEYRRLGREPREIELETLAQTWSEHCVHKTLKSQIAYTEPTGAGQGPSLLAHAQGKPGHSVDGATLRIDNLLKSTVAAATNALIGRIDPPAGCEWTRETAPIDWCLSVFVDNAGVIAFDDEHAVCFKAETHNRPSAIEPYGGAATGIGGCIRDVMGTGLSAKPIAATDVFCVAPVDTPTHEVPRGCLHPKRILSQVVAGVRDYGNRMGIPTVNGGVWQDARHIGNPLVFCGVIGVMPRSCVAGEPKRGDLIVALGGRTGRDGIHGATFSSAEVEHGHSTEFSHAVQIGNAITEKRALDAILEARDQPDGPLFDGITDCGAGGFSSAVGEMGKDLGATVHLEQAPTKYSGLSPTEVWISEAQERMVLAVPEGKLARLQSICDAHGCELSVLGTFGSDDGCIRLLWHGTEVGSLDTHFLHEGIPEPTRVAVWDPAYNAQFAPARSKKEAGPGLLGTVRTLLAHPNIASKAWIIRQYDHEVQGGTMVKPLQGVNAGPGDAAVMRPVVGSRRGLAIGNGLATGLAADPYLMTLAAVDECVRNLVCVGADPSRIAILDNFCWASCDDPRNLGGLVRAAAACLDAALAYRTPFISGKDSLKNQFRGDDGTLIQIPPTLLISGFGIVNDIEHACTMDAKRGGSALIAVGLTQPGMDGSVRATLNDGGSLEESMPVCDPVVGAATARAVAGLIRDGLVLSAHDCSEGGVLVAAAEMAFAGGLGVRVELGRVPHAPGTSREACAFGESPSRYLLEVDPARAAELSERLAGLPHAVIGNFTQEEAMELDGAVVAMRELRAAWESGSEAGS
ncbi:MAG: AIR synthase-related protein [Planctomycetota bacterium]|nr:AIR synthase-related protein [Planctomycetota bacterium]MDA1106675.1 AIR synthase-related protein [Planctomycetota bacterium]